MKQYDVSEAMQDLPGIIEAAEKSGAAALTGENGRPVAALMSMDAYGEYRRLKSGETAGWERPEKDLWDAIQEFRARHTPEQLAELDLAELYANLRGHSPDGR